MRKKNHPGPQSERHHQGIFSSRWRICGEGDGVLMTAGRHLSAALEGKDFPQGLGSRHIAAAGITSVTGAIAIAISESTGTVRIFKKGKIFVDIEKSME